MKKTTTTKYIIERIPGSFLMENGNGYTTWTTVEAHAVSMPKDEAKKLVETWAGGVRGLFRIKKLC